MLTNNVISSERLPRLVWEARRDAYQERMQPWVQARTERMSRHQKHPVYDFLFEYYSFRASHMLRWSPGVNHVLEGATREDVGWREFEVVEQGLVLPAFAFPMHRQTYLKWAIEYLDATSQREPTFTCLGLHEWAMVYRDPTVRHPQMPLRIARAAIDAIVESQPLRCTHFDAYRFFSAAAVPRNRIALTRADTTQHDQAGCIHVNMDLYKFAYLIAPYCPSELLADAFQMARTAREVDMRASPYDLTSLGFEPVRIETREGREEYIELQREVFRAGQPIRAKLLNAHRVLLR